MQNLQQKNNGNIDANDGQPLNASLRRRQMASRCQAQNQRQHQIERADYPHQRRVIVLQLLIEDLKQQQDDCKQNSATQKRMPEPDKRCIEAGAGITADGGLQWDGGVGPAWD